MIKKKHVSFEKLQVSVTFRESEIKTEMKTTSLFVHDAEIVTTKVTQ